MSLTPKFEIGDKVIVVNCIDGGYNKVGDILTVADIHVYDDVTILDYQRIVYFFSGLDSEGYDLNGSYEAELKLYEKR